MSPTVDHLLKSVNAELMHRAVTPFSDLETARMIVDALPYFHDFKKHIAHPDHSEKLDKTVEQKLSGLIPLLVHRGWIKKVGAGRYARTDHDSFAYLNGLWLEEYVWYAAKAAGMDEAYFGQKISWEGSNHVQGSNELDVILRRGDRLLLVSCKAISPYTEPGKTNVLSGHAQEVNYWIDHFFPNNAYGVLVTTADMVDERLGRDRYPEAEYRAEVQSVDILGLEDLRFESLRSYFNDPRQWTTAE